MKTLVLFLLSVVSSYGACNGWGNGYTYCRTVTIDHTKVSGSTQTDFPVLVTGTFTYLKTVGNGGNVQSASGFDIIFTSDATGLTTLKFERAVWSATTGTSEFWVKVSSVSVSVDTVIYLFYGNTLVSSDQSDHANTWDSNFAGVWHFGDGTSLSLTDSTGNANNGTNHSATACTGQIIGAVCFASGAGQYVDFGNNASLEIVGKITVEAWVKYTDAIPLAPTLYPIIASNAPTDQNGYLLRIHGGDGGGQQNQLFLQLDTGGGFQLISTGVVAVQNTIYSISGTYDTTLATKAHLYTNGGIRSSAFNTNQIGASTDPVLTGQSWAGFIDELRISNIARSQDWALTGYNNMLTPSTFYTIGNETTQSLKTGPRMIIFR